MKCDHAPGFGHDTTKLAFYSHGLAEDAHIGGNERGDCGPISTGDSVETAMRNACENEDVGKSVGKIIEDFATAARFARRERNHSIKHVAPEPKVAERGSDEQKEWGVG